MSDDELRRRTIDFSGRRWWVKRSDEPVGPGPNHFDDSPGSVEVQPDGSLALRIRRTHGRWTCAEVVAEEVTGYGRYEWTVTGDVSDLDRRAVFGMFTWSIEPCRNREIDIEVSAWGSTGGVIGQFVVQPSEPDDRRCRFTVPRAGSWQCSFDWSPSTVTFRAASGEPWRFPGPEVPTPGQVNPRINLWLYRGIEPLGSTPIEVRIRDFRFTPAGAPTDAGDDEDR